MSAINYPEDLLYHPGHGWARVHGPEAELGISWFAQDSLGEITFVDLPAVGTPVVAGDSYAEVESLKALSDVVAPLSGEVTRVNGDLAQRPDVVNDEPYGRGWLVWIRMSDPVEVAALLSAAAYAAVVDEASA